MSVALLAGPRSTHARLARRYAEAGIAVVSVADDVVEVRALLELDSLARANSVSIVIGAGFSPGLTCVLASHAAALFDQVDEIHVAKAGTGGPACASTHHRALGSASVDWRDGAWVKRRAGSGRELCWFPDPIGGADCYRASLPDALLLAPAFTGAERITARLAANRRDRVTARFPMLRPPHPEGGFGAVRVEVRGHRGASRAVQVLGRDGPARGCGRRRGGTGLDRGRQQGTAPPGRGRSGGAGRAAPVPHRARSARREGSGVRRRSGRLTRLRAAQAVAVAAPVSRSRQALASPMAVA